ncbi:substrate-binding periplasmic protein [Leptospira weilii]|uniref:ABC transporter, substrate-binding protein, family 3 n=2 Tax=Leptospira weilii TaxID=28184 RepID=M6PZT8_9LEPT|nr:transporter substrate-binding domain-containing protein [Leptospira weilii]EMM71237.1 ABC transporter, substrate-binding protein, family 3 [Leptospira weilii str. 2006001855]EMN43040.1 ABC transporter, substrate-binding protein, family 3 [Leptospira weilii str. LNT 1234]EMN88554.1 ABC transporter, substrate-binding protein, family 3 [Leptospira weilii str. UI 13098]MCL8266376.1 transporter substrate-binding domain-containing protein [Leptospira weilii]OMI19304.1 amino acid ABC transporter s
MSQRKYSEDLFEIKTLRSHIRWILGSVLKLKTIAATREDSDKIEWFWDGLFVPFLGIVNRIKNSIKGISIKPFLFVFFAVLCNINEVGYSSLGAEENTFRFYNLSRLKEILEKGELKVTGDSAYEPFYIVNAKEGYPGFDYELGKAYADFLGVKYKFVSYQEFNEFADAIKKKEVDIALSGISSNLERSKKVKFSKAYLVATPAALIRKSALPPPPEGNIITTQNFRSILDLADVNGVTFAVRSFSNRHEYLLKKFKNNRIFTYGDTFAAWEAVKNGTANCLVADSFYIKGLLLKDKSIASNFRPLLELVQREDISAAFPYGDLVFIRNFEFFLEVLERSGTLRELEDKYFNKSDWVLSNDLKRDP